MKILLLGGRGFLGSHIRNALIARGLAVRVFDRPPQGQPRPAMTEGMVELFDGDFLNKEDVVAAVEGCDAVIHLVSTTLPKSSNDNPAYDVQTNLAGSLHLLESARRAGVKKIIFASSGGTVYGTPQAVPIPESHPTEPICSYGIVKLAIEKYLHYFWRMHGLDYCVLRIANPYGEGQRVSASQGAVAVFLGRALRNDPIDIWGDGSVVRDFIYVSDVAGAFLRALDHEGPDRVFNIGSGRGHSLNELLAEIEMALGRPVTRRYRAARTFDVPSNVLSVSLAGQRLGWSPTTGLGDGLERTIRWLNDRKKQFLLG